MLTREEANERYGNVPCKFSSYYKYTFHFCGEADDGARVELSVGGNADDIYRYDVTPNTHEVMSGAYAVSIYDKGGEKLFESYDY